MSWAANVRLALKMENSNADDTSNYTPADIGTPVYSNTVFHDDAYSLQNIGVDNTKHIDLPLLLMNDINALNTFSISWWGRHEGASGNRYAFYLCKGNNPTAAGFIWAYTDSATNIFTYRWNGAYYELSAFTYATEKDTWINWAFTWSGTAGSTGTLKVYKNNALIQTVNTVVSSFGALNAYFRVAGEPMYGLSQALFVDNFVITNDIPASFPVEEVAAVSVTDCTPAAGNLGATAVTITGTSFAAGATVKFDGSAASSVVVVDSTSITCTTPAHAAGAVDIVVTNPDLTSGTLEDGYTYTAHTVSAISPATCSVFKTITVTITGTYFYGTPTVTFGSDAATGVALVSSTSITCTCPIATSAGAVTVTVTIGSTTATITFTYTSIDFKKRASPYTLFINDYAVTNYQSFFFSLGEEVNIITDYDVAFDTANITLPEEAYLLINGDIENVLTVKKDGETVWKGINEKNVLDEKAQEVKMTFVMSLRKAASIYAAYAQTTAKNIIMQINDILQAVLPAGYTADNLPVLAGLFQGHSVFINTSGEEVNQMDLLLTLLETYDIGLYVEKMKIKLFPVQTFPADAENIENFLKENASKLIERVDLKYTKVTVKYVTAVGGVEASTSAGTGTKELVIAQPANVYMSAAAAALLAARKLALRNVSYWETSLQVICESEIKVAQYVQYKDYVLFIRRREAGRLITNIDCIGVRNA